MADLIDMTGRVIGRLTVKERAPCPNKHTSDSYRTFAFWRCECSCGKNDNVVRSGRNLRTAPQDRASCGCLIKEINAARRKDPQIVPPALLESVCVALVKAKAFNRIMDSVDWKAAGVSRHQFRVWWESSRRITLERNRGGSPVGKVEAGIALVSG